MSDHFTEEHQAFRQSVREFIEREIRPVIDDWEAAGGWPREILPKLAELGMFAVPYPEKYGGLDLDLWFSIALIEELCCCGAFGFPMAMMVHAYMATPPIERWGSEALKQQWLVPAIKGEKLGALGITEPNAGSDVAAIRTTAVRQGDEYLINGSKTFITNGASADFIILACKTDTSRSGYDGISLILFPTDTPGFSVGRTLNKLGCHSSDTAELAFEDCRVPAGNLLGEEGQGFYYIMDNFQLERLITSIGTCASANWIFREAIAYTKQREAFGRPISKFQVLRHRFADMATEIEAGRLLAYRAAELHAAGKSCVKETTMAKLYCTELACSVTDRCLQVYGGYGYMEEYPAARAWRDARLGTLGAGTSEVMREILSKMVIDDDDFRPVSDSEQASAPSASVSEVFRLLPERFNAEQAGDFVGVFHFQLTGREPGEYTVAIESDTCTVESGIVGDATCSITVDSDTYVGITTGQGDPQAAFLSGKLQADNLEALLVLARCF